MNKNKHGEVIRKTNRSVSFKPGLYYHYQSSPKSDSLSAYFITADSNHQTYTTLQCCIIRIFQHCKDVSSVGKKNAENLNFPILSGPIRQILRIRTKKVYFFFNIVLNAIEKSTVCPV